MKRAIKKILQKLGIFSAHEWGEWSKYGFSYQHRYCRRCGQEQIARRKCRDVGNNVGQETPLADYLRHVKRRGKGCV